MDELAVVEVYGAVQGIAQTVGTLDDRIEDRLHVAGRTRDDAQDLAGGGLPLERRSEVVVARGQLLREPGILDRDCGLVGEGLEERDLLGREGADLEATDQDDTDGRPLGNEGRREGRS